MKKTDKGRLPRFVPVFRETLESPAWKATSFGARLLFIALKTFYNYKSDNNGKLYLAQRKAAEIIGSDKDSVARWFRELEYYRFIVKTRNGHLGFEGKGQAAHWRLTEVGLRGERPTHEFLFWNGVKFADQEHSEKNRKGFRIPSGKSGHSVRKIRTVVSRKSGHSRGKVSGKSGQRDRGDPSGKSGQSNSYYHLGGVGGALTEEETTNLTLPLMTVVEGGKTGSRTEGSSQVCVQCGGPIFRYKNGQHPVWLHRFCRRYWLHAQGAAS